MVLSSTGEGSPGFVVGAVPVKKMGTPIWFQFQNLGRSHKKRGRKGGKYPEKKETWTHRWLDMKRGAKKSAQKSTNFLNIFGKT